MGLGERLLVNKKFRQRIKPWIPLAVAHWLNRRHSTHWEGNYSSWAAAVAQTTGYSNEIILKQVAKAQDTVIAGRMAFERDGVTFDTPQYAWKLLASLLWVASRNAGNLSVVDFGGALGSTYFQHLRFLSHLPLIRWRIVEQPHFVAVGIQRYQNERLSFHLKIECCLVDPLPDTILFSSSIQYVPDPYDCLRLIRNLGFRNILFDRTGFLRYGPDRLTVQTVPASIYPASYPCWFFNETRFLSALREDYEIVAEFEALGGNIRIDGRIAAVEKGFLLTRKN